MMVRGITYSPASAVCIRYSQALKAPHFDENSNQLKLDQSSREHTFLAMTR